MALLDINTWYIPTLHAKIGFIAGFDFNMVNTGKHSVQILEKIECLDNWYASDKIYAAIDGDLGLKINFLGFP